MNRKNSPTAPRFGRAWRQRPQHVATMMAEVLHVLTHGGTVLIDGSAVQVSPTGRITTIGTPIGARRSDYVLLG